MEIKKSIVLFFSFILVFSTYSNLPNNIYGQSSSAIGTLYFKLDDQYVAYSSTSPHLFSGENQPIIIAGTQPRETHCQSTRDSSRDYLYTATDVYILSGTPSLNDRQDVSDVSGSPNTIITYLTGTSFDDELIGFLPPNGHGITNNEHYSILYDTCQDGQYNKGEDVYFTDAFEVKTPLPDFQKCQWFPPDPSPFADPECIVTPLPETTVEKTKKDARSSEASAEMTLALAKALRWYWFMMIGKQIAKNCLDTAAGGTVTCEAIKDGAKAGLNYLSGLILEQAKSFVKSLSGIVADPTDNDFKKLTMLPTYDNNLQFTGNNTVIESLGNIGIVISNENAVSEALLHSIERYRGAILANDWTWAIQHAMEIKQYSKLLSDQITENQEILTLHKLKVASVNSSFENDAKQMQKYRDKIFNFGYNETEVLYLKSLGYNDSQIIQSQNDFASLDFTIASKQEILTSLDNMIQKSQQFSSDLNELSNVFDRLVGELINYSLKFLKNEIPTVSVAGPHQGKIGQELVFEASNITLGSSASKIIKYEWDLDGDGFFDDATGNSISHVYDDSFQGFIGLHVTNEKGFSNIAYFPIKVIKTNNRPIIESVSPLPDQVSIITADTSIPFNISVSDIDDDYNDIEKTWYLDDKIVGSGNTFVYTPSVSELGIHHLYSNVTDKHQNTVIQDWRISVLLKDNDNDGWRSNVDCNDNNPAVNPSTTEILYNGIDDDCNPKTLDNNTKPAVSNSTELALQGSNKQIVLHATDPDVNTLKFILVDKPKNGTLTNPTTPTKSGTTYSSQVIYKSNSNFHDVDKFTYIVNDGRENSTLATVQVNVGILTRPTTSPVSRTIDIIEDTPTEIILSANSPDGHPLQFSLETTPGGFFGMFENFHQIGPQSASVKYVPPQDLTKDVSGSPSELLIPFTFRFTDGNEVPGWEGRNSNTGLVSLRILPQNDAPIPFNQQVKTNPNTPIIISLKASDVENDNIINSKANHGLNFEIVTQPKNGTLSQITRQVISSNPFPSTNDFITYTPSNGFTGIDDFTFRVTDGQLNSLENGNITIIVSPTSPNQNQEFQSGDIILGTANTREIFWYTPYGTLVKKITDNVPGYSSLSTITGGALDSHHNLYMTEFGTLSTFGKSQSTAYGISKWSKEGNFIAGWRDGFDCIKLQGAQEGCMMPESISIDNDDNLYVGGVAGPHSVDIDPQYDKYNDVRKFDVNGNLLATYDVDTQYRGSDWVELGPEQCTLYYTSENVNVKRYDVCKKIQLSDFINAYPSIRGPYTGIADTYALKLLPNGDFLVASSDNIGRFDNNGNLVKLYDAPGENFWFGVNTGIDKKSFWAVSSTSSGATNLIYKFDIDSGKVLQWFNVPTLITGIVVVDEPLLGQTNLAPVVLNSTLITNTDNSILFNITGSDIADDPLTFSTVTPPSHGTLGPIIQVTNNVSQVTYSPNSSFATSGFDSFTFKAFDGKLNSTNIGTIEIFRNHAPVANDDSGINTLQGDPINIAVLDNDGDIDITHPVLQDQIHISKIDTLQTLGNVTLNNDNTTINYVPFAPQYIGPDSFNYTIADSYGLQDTAQVLINVLSSNNIPVAQDQSLFTMENTPKTIQLVASDADPDDQNKLVYLLTGGPRNGYLSYFNSTTGLAEYKPLKAFHGQDSFTFKVHDGKDKSNIASVNITVADDFVNDRPRVTSERVYANVSQPININVLANDIDPNGDFLTLTNFTGPFNGTAFLNPDQTITYQSDPDFNASDALYYRVADNLGAYNIGQLIIDVKGDALTQTVEVPESVNVITKKDTPIDIRLVATSLIKRTLEFYISDQPVDGTLSNFVMTADDKANVTYTPNAGFTGDDSFKYLVTDPKSGTISNIGTIDVIIEDIITNNPPVAKDEQVSVDEDNSIQIRLNATDPDTDSGNNVLTYQITTQPTSGQITDFDKDTGILTYKPNPDFNGQDSFTFKAHDNGDPELDSNVATISITVNPVNDPPVASDQHVQTDKDTSLSIQLQGTDPDNGDSISSFAIVDQPKSGSISLFDSTAGTLTYTPNTDFAGDDSFTFKVVDSNNAQSENTGTVFIVVKDGTTPPPDTVPPGYTAPPSSSLCLDPANENTKGTQNDDNLIGTNKKETINGLGGNDSINACSGNDTVNGNSGNDGINGDEGKDKIHGNEGNDYLLGGDGDDEIHGNEGNDILKGGDGDDDLFGNEGDDILTGGPGADKFACGSGNDRITDYNESEGDSKKGDCEVF